MIRASVDIGSNSVLLLVAEVDKISGRIIKEILNLSSVTSLGKDLDKTKKFHPESMAATKIALTLYKAELDKINFEIGNVLVTATEASRIAINAKDFFLEIFKELGFKIILVSALGEAYYTALGVGSTLEGNEQVVIMDMGGASTELIKIKLDPFEILSTISLPVGSVRAADWLLENNFESNMATILDRDFSPYMTKSLIGVAGTMTSLASMFFGHHQFSDKDIDGKNIKFSAFKDFCLDLQKTNIANLLLLFPYLGKRAPMLAAGATVACMIGEKLGVEQVQISTRGLRYGVLIQGEINEKFSVG